MTNLETLKNKVIDLRAVEIELALKEAVSEGYLLEIRNKNGEIAYSDIFIPPFRNFYAGIQTRSVE